MNINFVLYAYMYMCIALLIYSIVYTSKASITKKMNYRRSFYWQEKIHKQMINIQNHHEVEKKHNQLLKRKLIKTKELLAYVDALESMNQDDTFQQYLKEISSTLLTLSTKYAKVDNMNKTILSYMITQYSIFNESQKRSLIKILLGYLENSNLYTREYVFNAIYTMGNVDGVERALQIMNDYHYFHHKKMISNGLVTFQGSHHELMARLCSHFYDWNENIMISVIDYISTVHGPYQKKFQTLLTSPSMSIEIKIAIIRYFHKNRYDPILPILYQLMENPNTDINIIIVIATTLSSYPCQKTYEILKKQYVITTGMYDIMLLIHWCY